MQYYIQVTRFNLELNWRLCMSGDKCCFLARVKAKGLLSTWAQKTAVMVAFSLL